MAGQYGDHPAIGFTFYRFRSRRRKRLPAGESLGKRHLYAGVQLRQRLSSGSKTARLGNWINGAAYQPNPLAPLSTGGSSDATLFGNTPRNCLIGPPQKNVDFSLGKIFKLTESQNLRFLVDFFNLFNHPSFANPAFAAVGSTAASGSAPITSTIGTPR